MSQSPTPTRVKGGLPWWLWGLLIAVTVSVVGGVLFSSVPEDPAMLYSETQKTVESGDVKAAPAMIAALEKYPDYVWHARFLDGVLAFRTMRDPRALKLFNEIPEDHELKAEAYRRIGNVHQRGRRYAESMKAFEKSIALSGGAAPDASLALSRLYDGIGAYKLAESALDKVIENSPEFMPAYEQRAVIRMKENQPKEAFEDFKVFLSTPGQFSAASPAALAGYKDCILELKDKERIQQLIDEHLDLFEEKDVRISLQLAAGNLAAAVEEMETKNKGPEPNLNPAVREQMVRIFIEQKDWKAAGDELKELVNLKSRDLAIYELAVQVYRATKEAEKLAVAEENIKQLSDLHRQLDEKIQVVSNSIENAEGRAEVGRLCMKLSQYPDAIRWFTVAASIDETFTDELQEAASGKTFPRNALVEFPSAISTEKKSEKTPEPADAKDAKETDPPDDRNQDPGTLKPAEDDKPGDEKPTVDRKPTVDKPIDNEKIE